MSTQAYHDSSFMKEVWGLYGVGVAIMVVRFIVRTRAVGVRGWQGDDWMALAVLACYICDAATVELCYKLGTNLDFPQEQLREFSDEDRDKIEFGSKMQLLAWVTYTALVWGLKGQMLFFYNRLTFGLRQQQFVKIMGVVVACTYVAVFLTIMLGCYPTHKNWQVIPDPGLKCTFKMQNFYVSTVLNVLTDVAVLDIPVPLLWALQVPKRQKIWLVLLLCSGIFVIAAALVRIIMTLMANPSALTINRWGVRETIAGIIAVNIPIVRPVFTSNFWSRDFPPGLRKSRGKSSAPHSGSRSAHQPRSSRFGKLHAFEMSEDLHTVIDNRDENNKQFSNQTTVVELDNGSTSDVPLTTNSSSEDLVVQKPSGISRQGRRSVSYHESDLEAAYPPMHVSVDTRYEIGPASGFDSPRGH